MTNDSLKLLTFGLFSIYFTALVFGVINSTLSICNKKITYIGHYTGLGYVVDLGCKLGKPMEDK